MSDRVRDRATREVCWTIGESMALELDAALSFIGGYLVPGDLPVELTGWLRSLPADWRGQWPEFLGESGRFVSVLETVAYLAGVTMDGDYARATLAMREITAEKALNTGNWELAHRIVAVKETAYADVGLAQQEDQARKLLNEAERAVRILRGGDLHARFWHWLDRFYYESYQPWRQSRREIMEAWKKQALAALGDAAEASYPPPVDWLPRTNPLLRHPELSGAVREGRLAVHFWVEPFGMPDAWTLWPGWLITSFAWVDELYRNYQAFAADVANRAKALADPTRLIILRMIRHFGMINTELAASLDLARPTVSVHAKILREAGLIRSRKEERQVRHEVVPQEVRRLFRDLERFLDLPEEE